MKREAAGVGGGTEEGDALPAAQGYLGTSSTWTAARSVAGGAPPADGAQELRRSQCARHPTALGQGRSSPGAHTAEQCPPSLLLPPCGVPCPLGCRTHQHATPASPGSPRSERPWAGLHHAAAIQRPRLPPWYWHSGARPRLQSPLVANVLSSRGTGGEASLRGLGRALPSSARPRVLTCGTRKVAARSSWCISDQPFVPRRVSVENTQTRGRVGSSSFVLPSDFS